MSHRLHHPTWHLLVIGCIAPSNMAMATTDGYGCVLVIRVPDGFLNIRRGVVARDKHGKGDLEFATAIFMAGQCIRNEDRTADAAPLF